MTETINYTHKVKEVYENGGNHRVSHDLQGRDFATLKPLYTPTSSQHSEKQVYASRTENTDGKIFTHVEKSKHYNGPIVPNSQGNSRVNENRDGRSDINGDAIDNGFLERFSAFYNIPAV